MMHAIANILTVVNFLLVCWLVIWSIVTERRLYFLKGAMETRIHTELSDIKREIITNTTDITNLHRIISETVTKVDLLLKGKE